MMRQRFGVLVVTYNALFMGFTLASNVRGIRSVLKTIADDGLKPKMTSPKIASSALASQRVVPDRLGSSSLLGRPTA